MSAGGKTPAMPSSPNAGQRHGQQVHGHKHLGELAITLFFLLSLFIFSSTFCVVLLNAPSLPNASHIKYLHFVFSRSISFPLPFFSLLRHEQGLLGKHAHAGVAVDAGAVLGALAHLAPLRLGGFEGVRVVRQPLQEHCVKVNMNF